MTVLDNPKWELFAQARAEGKSSAEAYRLAGYNDNDSNAARLNGNERVSARIMELLEDGAQKTVTTVASIITELEEAREVAKTVEQPASMVAASMGKAKVAGLLADRFEHTGKDGGPIVTEELSPTEAARRMAFTLVRGAQDQDPTKTTH